MITKRAIIFIIPALLNLFHISVATESKCASILVTVEGVIIGSQDDTFKIAVRVIPDSNSSLQPEIPITNGHFKGSILFDTTESGSSNRHKCARVPEKVHARNLQTKVRGPQCGLKPALLTALLVRHLNLIP